MLCSMYRGIMLCPAYAVVRGVSAIQGFLMYTSIMVVQLGLQ